MIGQRLNNRYTIISLLGEGGMGEVYLASDEQNNQQVAVKILARQLTAHLESLERFRREAKTLRQLDHPNIVKFIDAFEHESQYVIVMEYMPGGSLHDVLKQGQLPIERAREIGLGLCDALIRSHQLSIIHRDIKPENVLLDENGIPKLADFGVARLSEGTRMTRSGTQVGTPYYMSPEAWEGKQLDGQADIWSLGALLFEMLSGQIPFSGDTPLTVMNKIFTSELPDLKKLRKDVPNQLVQIVKRMLTKDKSKRYKTMRQVAVDLESDEPIVSSKPVKPTKSTRLVTPKEKIDFSRYQNIFIIGILVIVLIFAINLIPSMPTNISIPVSPTPELRIVSTMISEKDEMTLVYVPEGEFTMGRDDGFDSEKPSHQVYLDAFWIDQTEVTNSQYGQCVVSGGCTPPEETNSYTHISYYANFQFDNYPVIYVNWYQANEYCSWANRRLPSEAEWEKAARGTEGRIYPWGDMIDDGTMHNFCDAKCTSDHANNSLNDGYADVSPIGNYPAGTSVYGVLDMMGNVMEWVNDWYSETYYNNSPKLNPTGPISGEPFPGEPISAVRKVIRGTSWFDYNGVTSTFRGFAGPSVAEFRLGFRCALSESKASSTEQTTQVADKIITPTSPAVTQTPITPTFTRTITPTFTPSSTPTKAYTASLGISNYLTVSLTLELRGIEFRTFLISASSYNLQFDIVDGTYEYTLISGGEVVDFGTITFDKGYSYITIERIPPDYFLDVSCNQTCVIN